MSSCLCGGVGCPIASTDAINVHHGRVWAIRLGCLCCSSQLLWLLFMPVCNFGSLLLQARHLLAVGLPTVCVAQTELCTA